MADRAYNNGVMMGAALATAGATVKRGVIASGRGIKTGAVGTKDAATSFWAGLKSGIKRPSQQLGHTVPERTTDLTPHIIVVSKI